MSSVAKLAFHIDANRTDLLRETIAALPQPVFGALPMCEETVDACLRAMSAAVRARNPHAIRRWLTYQTHAPDPHDLLACLNAAIAQISLDLPSHQKDEMTQALRFLDWIR